MSKNEKKNITASVLQRLKNHSRTRREDHGLTLTNYSIERFLYRLSISEYRDQFVLKGAQLFRMWAGSVYRPTRDLDLLRFGSPDISELKKIFQDICNITIDVEDGIDFLSETVRGQAIREENQYDGVRIKLEFRIGRAGQFMQIDIGFGDAVNPPAIMVKYPCILEMPAPNFRAYRPETVIAEKVEAMVSLGFANSRMKDFYDVHKLAEEFDFDGEILKEAIRLTFQKRKTSIPTDPPLAFTREFSDDSAKQIQWNAFINKNSLKYVAFSSVVEKIKAFVEPVFLAINNSDTFDYIWNSDENWINSSSV